ncbi:hypothetical protein J6590_062382 [Homalodisca vitripennis]|nr:hypothetical protein J6590_062382 [Homalodisca vitripennis]
MSHLLLLPTVATALFVKVTVSSQGRSGHLASSRASPHARFSYQRCKMRVSHSQLLETTDQSYSSRSLPILEVILVISLSCISSRPILMSALQWRVSHSQLLDIAGHSSLPRLLAFLEVLILLEVTLSRASPHALFSCQHCDGDTAMESDTTAGHSSLPRLLAFLEVLILLEVTLSRASPHALFSCQHCDGDTAMESESFAAVGHSGSFLSAKVTGVSRSADFARGYSFSCISSRPVLMSALQWRVSHSQLLDNIPSAKVTGVSRSADFARGYSFSCISSRPVLMSALRWRVSHSQLLDIAGHSSLPSTAMESESFAAVGHSGSFLSAKVTGVSRSADFARGYSFSCISSRPVLMSALRWRVSHSQLLDIAGHSSLPSSFAFQSQTN